MNINEKKMRLIVFLSVVTFSISFLSVVFVANHQKNQYVDTWFSEQDMFFENNSQLAIHKVLVEDYLKLCVKKNTEYLAINFIGFYGSSEEQIEHKIHDNVSTCMVNTLGDSLKISIDAARVLALSYQHAGLKIPNNFVWLIQNKQFDKPNDLII